MQQQSLITASELAEYVYCKRAWWLRLQGLLSENDAMREGQVKHVKLSEWVIMYRRNVLIAFFLILLGILFAIVALYFLYLEL